MFEIGEVAHGHFSLVSQGDEVEIYIITKDGIKQDTLQLKKD